MRSDPVRASRYSLGLTSVPGETERQELRVEGKLPEWLRGTLLRTAPAKFEVGEQKYNHWFDGLAMLHSFRLEAGRVSYQSRFLRSHSFREAEETGMISRSEFATDPCRSLFGRIAAVFDKSKPTDNCNVSINKLGSRIVAFTETPLPVVFDAETLETLGVYEYDDAVKADISIAHPHLDFERGCSYSYVLKFGRQSEYRLFKTDWRTGRQSVFSVIPVKEPAYMHSIGMTGSYLVAAEFPFVVNPLRLRFAFRPFIQNYRWEKERGVRFHVVSKETGRVVRTAVGDAAFAFHHVNAFEDQGDVIIDMVVYPDPGVIDQLYLRQLRSDAPVTATAKLARYRIPLNGGGRDVRSRVVSDSLLELPRIDYRRCAGRPYRVVYGAGNQGSGDFIDNLVKVDVLTGNAAKWYEKGCYPGEPVFVASPDSRDEDDGVILSVVLDTDRQGSFLLVLDAASLNELARAKTPVHIPFGLHGNYLADPDLPESYSTLHR